MTPAQLHQLRGKLNLSQVQLAQLLGVHPLTVSKWGTWRTLRRPLTRVPFSIRLQSSWRTKDPIGHEVGRTSC